MIWSTPGDSRGVLPPPSGQRFPVPHMDAKADANTLFLERLPDVTLLLTSFFRENLIEFGMGPRRRPDGGIELALPLGAARLYCAARPVAATRARHPGLLNFRAWLRTHVGELAC
ncbi:MAG: hypothetical protein AB7P21_19180 [Lautropia sp.]